jgi:hypothetical protein
MYHVSTLQDDEKAAPHKPKATTVHVPMGKKELYPSREQNRNGAG